MCKFGIDTLRYFSYTYPLVVLIYASDIVADYVCVCVCVCDYVYIPIRLCVLYGSSYSLFRTKYHFFQQ